MKLELALDTFTPQSACALAERLQDFIDIVEVGTPMLLNYGMAAVRDMKKAVPGLTLFADTKIIDGARIEACAAFDAGADIISVVACAQDQTIADAVSEASRRGKKVLVDFIAVKDLAARAAEISGLGADIFCVHMGVDVQKMGQSHLPSEILQIKQAVNGPCLLYTSHIGSIWSFAKVRAMISAFFSPLATTRKVRVLMMSSMPMEQAKRGTSRMS